MNSSAAQTPWYSGISRYQWLVLVIACLGWVFDVYEGQIFNLTRADMLEDIVTTQAEARGETITEAEVDAAKKYWGDVFLAVFLAGGTFGGILFGSLADRYGRRRIMIFTILMYSIFSGLTYFANSLEVVAILRFLVAMGVGGEWAVAAALVAEVFPTKARAHASGIFHASSVLGTWLAAWAAIAVGDQWRFAYLIGVLPALLVVWVRASVREPEQWKAKAAEPDNKGRGNVLNLLTEAAWRPRALFGMGLAAVGLGTFWAVVVAGQGLAENMLLSMGVADQEASQRAKFAYGIIQTIGGGLGLLAFGPVSAIIGRKKTFIIYHVAALLIVPIVCYLPQNYTQLAILLPVFGFFTLGMHAGYAVYFPELFPTRLRATGTSFCFNGGRLIAVPVLLYSGTLKATEGVSLESAVTGLSLLFLLGVVLILFLPETKGKDLPE